MRVVHGVAVSVEERSGEHIKRLNEQLIKAEEELNKLRKTS